ncbi:hypothetical protein BC830DRAFT_1106885 [Chytriomyces sp. MP71]|nr:hypothetical protein BC830DRAFT_1106885 [Chytriomyces sp. MP71]
MHSRPFFLPPLLCWSWGCFALSSFDRTADRPSNARSGSSAVRIVFSISEEAFFCRLNDPGPFATDTLEITQSTKVARGPRSVNQHHLRFKHYVFV